MSIFVFLIYWEIRSQNFATYDLGSGPSMSAFVCVGLPGFDRSDQTAAFQSFEECFYVLIGGHLNSHQHFTILIITLIMFFCFYLVN